MTGVAVMCLSAVSLMAQGGGPGGGGPGGGGGFGGGGPGGGGFGGGGPGGGGGFGNFDPAQFQQQRMEALKTQLEITDDTEWAALQPLIQKVMDAQTAVRGDAGSAFGMGMGRGGRGGAGGFGGAGGAPGGRGGMFGATTGSEMQAVQRALDGKASKEDTKAALAKLAEVRKAHQAALEKAQDDLRKVLTVQQEATLTVSGYL
jgi:hypothetical protein